MRFEENVVREPVGVAVGQIKNKLTGYFSHASEWYLGVTARPERRRRHHERNGWERMVVLYEAFSSDIAIDLERELIHWARGVNLRGECANQADGGEGVLENQPRVYVYVLLRPRSSS